MSTLSHISPDDTYETLTSRGYTQVVVAEDIRKVIYLSGQLPLATDGRVVGAGDIAAQARTVFENIRVALASAGATLHDVTKMQTYVTDIVKHPAEIRKVRTAYFGSATPPASTMVEVPRFAHPDILIEIDVIAAL